MKHFICIMMKIEKDILKLYFYYFVIFMIVFIQFILSESRIKYLDLFWMIIFFVELIIPCIQDFKYAVEKSYIYVEGVVKDNEKSGADKLFPWKIIELAYGNRKVYINVLEHKNINNKYCIIEWLPHTKFGKIREIKN